LNGSFLRGADGVQRSVNSQMLAERRSFEFLGALSLAASPPIKCTTAYRQADRGEANRPRRLPGVTVDLSSDTPRRP
jgi:hypothetical protein